MSKRPFSAVGDLPGGAIYAWQFELAFPGPTYQDRTNRIRDDGRFDSANSVYVTDIETGSVEEIASNAAPRPWITGDGRYVLSAQNGPYKVTLHDRQTG